MTGRTPVNITGYTVDDNVTSADDLFSIAMGATLVLLGEDALTDDAIDGSGRVSVRGPTTIDDGLTLSGAALLVDMTAVTQNGYLTLGETSDDSVIARNIAGATWTLANGATITGDGASQFVNLGLLDQASGSSTIDANFYDRIGTIEVNGTLDFASPGKVNRFVNDTIDGGGLFKVDDGGVLVGSNVSTSIVDFVNARSVGDVTVSSPEVDIGTLTLGTGSVVSFTGEAAIVYLGDEIVGGGEVDIMGDATVFSFLDGTRLVGDLTLVNSGDSSFTSGDSSFGAIPANFLLDTNPSVGHTITIENSANATWTDAGDGSGIEQAGSAGKTVFINDGTFVENTPEGVTFDVDIINNGLMEFGPKSIPSAPGHENEFQGFFLNRGLGGTGTVEVGPGNVFIGGALGGSQTFNFNAVPDGEAAAPLLTLEGSSSFSAAVTGFDRNGATDDQIAIDGGWQYQDFVLNSSGTGGSLMFTNGSAESALSLTGAYDPLGFHAAVSGTTTTITYG